MAVILNLQVTVKPGKRKEALEFMNSVLPETRSYDGCCWVYVASDPEDENRIEVFSLWDSKKHYDTYLQWRKDTGIMKEAEEFFAGEPLWRFLDLEISYK